MAEAVSIQERKREIRGDVRARLEAIDAAEAHRLSVAVCERIIETDWFERSRVVMLYMPIAGEVDVAPLALRCFQTDRVVCVPRTDHGAKRILPVEIHDFEDASPRGPYGVREPVSGRVATLGELDLVVVPGLAFDRRGCRLGRGGGFYDRFLTQEGFSRRCVRCGAAFSIQLVDEAPVEDHDVRLDGVATDQEMIRASRS